MCDDRIPNIDEVVDLLGLERSPRYQNGATTYMVRCPFCGELSSKRKYQMKIDVEHGVYHCYACGNGQKGTGTLDLYARCRMGTSHTKGASGNGQEILKQLLHDMGRDIPVGHSAAKKSKGRPKPPPIPASLVARDAALDKAYQFILTFPAFRLEQRHKANLIKRGLDAQTIERNQYATMPKDVSWIRNYPTYGKLYDNEGLEAEKMRYQALRDTPKARIVAGLILAAEMMKQGISPKGVPGSFLLGKRWCFIYRPGMMVPTRNRKGEVVALQTRTDYGDVRYLTYSASTLPYGVAKDISRVHFPLANCQDPKMAKEVLLTEGPLKADVAAYLYGAPVFFMALHGVGNTRELITILRALAFEGVTRAGNAFDMDKLCNINVRDSSKALNKMVREAGLSLYQKCWDMDYAKTKWEELHNLCKRSGLMVVQQTSTNIFVQIAKMADALYEAKIVFCRKQGKDGQEEKDYWRDETKGLDDYLLFTKQQTKAKSQSA